VEEIKEDRERTFILDCLRVYLFNEPNLITPSSILDGDKFYLLLLQYKLVGLFSILGRSYPDLWPRAVKEKLREDRYRQLPYNDWCSHQVETILSSLQVMNIPVIVLKSWAVIPKVYDGDPSQRPALDIDLLVKTKDVLQVNYILHGLSYLDGKMEPWPGYFRRFINSAHYISSQSFSNSDQAFNIDLHWGYPDSPYYDRRINIEKLFQRAQPLTLAWIRVNSLATEDYLIYASVHAAHHGYNESLSRYYEIAALLLQTKSSIDWKSVLTSASI
jgi:hypothetical protein